MAEPVTDLLSTRSAVRDATLLDETEAVNRLKSRSREQLTPVARGVALEEARYLVGRCRAASDEAGTLDAFLREFGLENDEGVALMCLAEALLRVPDDDTADRLISEKIRAGDWAAHAGRSESGFVNASVWGLMLTGQLVTLDPEIEQDSGAWLRRLVSRIGEPVVRTAVLQAMRILGGQYVLGRTIGEALRRGRSQAGAAARFSFDMLGEGARTSADAERYFEAYVKAIESIGAKQTATDPRSGNGISVKLSALHPRFEEAQRRRVLAELPERLLALAVEASRHQLGFSIDAEETARLELTMDLFEGMARDPALDGWDGLGFVLQAYQKRALPLTDWLAQLARSSRRLLMVMLVKGAYWDAEIKHAQELGLSDYPVFTRKANTDLSYEVCAARLLEQPDAIYPQFATHNAATVSMVRQLAGDKPFEFQRLHGMGEMLYSELGKENNDDARLAPRIYAPVGSHQDLLPYLVRRLLENGANSSFVNRFLDAEVPIAELLQDTLVTVERAEPARHPEIPAPPDLYRYQGHPRANSAGFDLDNPSHLKLLTETALRSAMTRHRARPIICGAPAGADAAAREIFNPANPAAVVGDWVAADEQLTDKALNAATAAAPAWDRLGGEQRAKRLEAAAVLLEARTAELMGLIGAEAGRTLADALSEVREAVDFLRYYALGARLEFASPLELPGPTGELNELSLHGRGVFACISPWNFPLAIFTGQVAAALAAGNAVIAKPAEQTPLTAAAMVRLLHEAGIPPDVLHLLPGDGGSVGAALVADERVAGIAFTGSTDTAQHINRGLAARSGPIVPLIAETGGQNVMIADSTALPEQLVDDVIISAFQSAGQRCSALRVLYLQEDIADRVEAMLAGAMAELRLGDPLEIDTDVGPVIDEAARGLLIEHDSRMTASARLIARTQDVPDQGWFFPPTAFAISSISELPGEVFGPILHVIRYPASALDRVIDEVNATGYGLTLGVHSRIEGFARYVFRRTRVGNTYINRNMVGAVVGVNPFGGQGLSGTGPKAGGPHYLHRFATERTRTDNLVARGGNTSLFELGQ